jgi:hypothetical protein
MFSGGVELFIFGSGSLDFVIALVKALVQVGHLGLQISQKHAPGQTQKSTHSRLVALGRLTKECSTGTCHCREMRQGAQKKRMLGIFYLFHIG